ncbi:hypothetical protein FIBSPDRAFT_901154 [Athelia psychrophila]|uniref:F-box domain-containing protein n=1 Tax=Athelia psychrophila TaxID=1759441 RepID=A0A165XIS9_9AGAM|nr:hypothetical protein FIBSPDRAFT_901154 [Fibularhizoctonia sp. CBS 109695]
MYSPHPSIYLLPAEILKEIYKYLCAWNLVALARTSKRLNATAISVLYSIVEAGTPGEALKRCKAIESNPTAAKAVRHVCIVIDGSLCTRAFFRVIDTAISSASGIVSLALDITEGFQHLDLLAASTFPYLRMLKLSGEMSKNLARFIRTHSEGLRHLTFTHIVPIPISDSQEAIIIPPRRPLNVTDLGSFPHLTTYTGDGRLLPLILPGSLVHHVHTYFIGEKDAINSLGFLHTVSAPLQSMALITTGWYPDALAVIARQAPFVTGLHWRRLSTDGHEVADLAILLAFSMVSKNVLYRVESAEELVEDYKMIQSWSQALPSVVQFQLPYTGIKYRQCYNHNGKWVPDWSDNETYMRIVANHCIVVSDLIALPWLEAFATGVARYHSLPNPYHLKSITERDFMVEMLRAVDKIEEGLEGLNIATAQRIRYIKETITFLCKLPTEIGFESKVKMAKVEAKHNV